MPTSVMLFVPVLTSPRIMLLLPTTGRVRQSVPAETVTPPVKLLPPLLSVARRQTVLANRRDGNFAGNRGKPAACNRQAKTAIGYSAETVSKLLVPELFSHCWLPPNTVEALIVIAPARGSQLDARVSVAVDGVRSKEE